MSGQVTMDGEELTGRAWTEEQRLAITRREGNLLLAAGAGSGKTSVLVERFVRAVLEDGLDVGAILTITFTEKAAAEMRDRIRGRFRELGAEDAAAATEGATIATIHGFCARLLRAYALAAGLDPAFRVLDDPDARRLADRAFDETLEALTEAERDAAVELIAAYTVPALRIAILATHDELRSRGESTPRLPPLPPPPDLEAARAALRDAAAAVAAELGTITEPGVRVVQALERLERCDVIVAAAEPWPGALGGLALPRGNGAALSTPVCEQYTEALAELRTACEHRRAARVHRLLDELLVGFGRRYSEAKRGASALDFTDLELLTRALLTRDTTVRDRLRARYRRVMVDEFQDTNRVQLELIEAVAAGNLFTVGDAQQSIYGFRHAEVELFERLAGERREQGEYASLRTNFRTRREVLDVINAAFARTYAAEPGHAFVPLLAGRADPPAADPRVELYLADKGVDWQIEGPISPWRIAEARRLAERVAALLAGGTAARDTVVLTRATTDLRVYERALEERGVPTYLIGGRGYWAHPQVLDMLAALRALANPRDEEALLTVLASPLVGVSLDALVIVTAAARSASADPWQAVREPEAFEALAALADEDRARLARFAAWFAAERAHGVDAGIEALLDRVLDHTGYDLWVLATPGGRRRLANVRKLMRLAREHETANGPGLRAFLAALRARAREGAGSAREAEAPVEGEALDAVRLMTIHRSKGLEFDVVCVADLGRVRRQSYEVLRIGRDGALGLRLADPAHGKREPALAYRAIGEERERREEAEERRLFYVAMTRARERLVLSGAARLDKWPESNGGTAAGWIARALAPDLGEWLTGDGEPADLETVTEEGVAVHVARVAPAADAEPPASSDRASAAVSSGAAGAAASAPIERVAVSPLRPAALSYSALTAYRRCGYRYYVERELRLPPRPADPNITSTVVSPASSNPPSGPSGRLSAAERGTLTHALLEALDHRHPREPTPATVAATAIARGLPAPEESDIATATALVGGFARTELAARLGRATQVRREQPFAFPLGGSERRVTGVLDVLARERAGMLVIDYKTDRLLDRTPAAAAAADYADQRLIYALAVLLSGAAAVEVVLVYLERPDHPVTSRHTAEELPFLRDRLAALTDGIERRAFSVAPDPHRALCDGCPAEGGLCSWPLALTRRASPDQLF